MGARGSRPRSVPVDVEQSGRLCPTVDQTKGGASSVVRCDVRVEQEGSRRGVNSLNGNRLWWRVIHRPLLLPGLLCHCVRSTLLSDVQYRGGTEKVAEHSVRTKETFEEYLIVAQKMHGWTFFNDACNKIILIKLLTDMQYIHLGWTMSYQLFIQRFN